MWCAIGQTPQMREVICGHILGRPAFGELLEAPQFGHLEVGALHLAGAVEEDIDLAVAFQPGDGIDRDPAFLSQFSH